MEKTPTKQLLLETVVVLVFAGASIGSSVPIGWEKFCTSGNNFVDWNFTTLQNLEVKTMLQISCELGKGDTLRFTEIRNWTESLDLPRKVALQVTCSGDAVLHIPWPMKARHLVFIRATGCRLEDYFTEYFDPIIELLPDELRVIEMVDTVVPITVPELFGSMLNIEAIPKPGQCGPDTAEKLVFSGMQHVVPFFENIPENLTIAAVAEEIEDYYDQYDDESDFYPDYSPREICLNISKRENLDISDLFLVIQIEMCLDWLLDENINSYSTHHCNFKNLVHLDESKSFMHYYYLDLLKRNSLFSALRVYNLSDVNYDMVPVKLREWRSHTKFPAMEYLDLSHNQISNFSFIEVDSSGIGVAKGIIDLRFNSISTLPMESLDNLFQMKTVTVLLQNNPFNCSCNAVADLYQFLADRKDLKSYEYLRQLTCVSPGDRKGIKIGELTREQAICKVPLPKHIIWLISVLGVVVVILGLVIFLIITFRREVTILIYTRLGIEIGCKKSEVLPSQGKDYDVFVSACDQDKAWVETNVISVLHRHKGEKLRLCLRDRDWELGAPIADNAVKSVESSVHTVAVVSRDYIADEWRAFEFSVALHQTLREKRRHLVVIFKEAVSKDLLVPEMRKYAEITPCIHFTKRLYVDRLLYALSHYERQEICLDSWKDVDFPKISKPDHGSDNAAFTLVSEKPGKARASLNGKDVESTNL